VRLWNKEVGYLRGRRTGERGGNWEGLRMERNFLRASEGKLDLGDARGDAFGALNRDPSGGGHRCLRGSWRNTICHLDLREQRRFEGDVTVGGQEVNGKVG
jgi:hypothetical protein